MRSFDSGRQPVRSLDADRYLGLASAIAGLLGIIALSSALWVLSL